MACPFCYSPYELCNVYQKETWSPLIQIVVPPEFQKCLYVLCKHRHHFNDQFLLDEDNGTHIITMARRYGQLFKILAKGTDDRTTISGPGLRRLMYQYSLEAGDTILINIKKIKGTRPIIVYNKEGDEKRPIQGASTIDDQIDDHYANIIVTDSVELNQHKDEMLVEFLYKFLRTQDPSYAPLFVHNLTRTNITKKELKLAKDVFEGIALARTGTVNILKNLNEDFCQCSYSIAKDGRMTIRSGWNVFTESNGLNVGMTVVMAFSMLEGVLHMFLNILE